MPDLEAVLLTGGRSSRMGRDKATLPVDGVPQAKRIIDLLSSLGVETTVLGREPVEGASFLPDHAEFAGPLAALARYEPKREFVLVLSCDLPRFSPAILDLMKERIESAQAAVPVVDGFRQPLCALYRSQAFGVLQQIEDPCAMGWLDALQVQLIPESDMAEAGIDPRVARGANTPEEFKAALEGADA